MQTLITNDIKISVENFYRPEHSAPSLFKFVFSYEINIHNMGDRTVQLLRRHWYIMDALGLLREVEGPGIIGKQPILKPGNIHQYESGCELTTNIGKMYGYYLMEDLNTGEHLKILIPEFQMIAAFKNN